MDSLSFISQNLKHPSNHLAIHHALCLQFDYWHFCELGLEFDVVASFRGLVSHDMDFAVLECGARVVFV